MTPRKLTAYDASLIVAHLTSFQGEDRRLRFGGMVSDTYITDYVENSFLYETQWFGVTHIDGHLVAACHAAIQDGQAELGCSVIEDFRGQGLAQLMFDRAITWLRTKGITEVYMHCLTENGAMKHIARKNQMTLQSDYGETDALVDIQPATALTPFADAMYDRIAVYDSVYRNHMNMMRKLYRA